MICSFILICLFFQIDWNRSDTLKLIELWQTHEILYNSQHPMYYNKNAKNDALLQIKEKMSVPAIEIKDIKVN